MRDTMKTVKNDLNLFKAYKAGPGKATHSGARGLVGMIILFIVLVAAGYTAPYLLQMQVKQQADAIRAELAIPEVAELQQKLNQSVNKNSLLLAYLEVLNHAEQGFAQSNFIDSELFDVLADCMPTDTSIKSLDVNAHTLQMTCTSPDRLAPAKLAQTLKDTGVFSSITYDGVVRDDDNLYTFNMQCLFDRAWADRDKPEKD